MHSQSGGGWRLGRLKLGLLVAVLGIGLLVANKVKTIFADEPEGRTSFTYHVYVDPIHGDDDLAFNPTPSPAPAEGWFNPRGSGTAAPPYALQSHPIPASISGNLQHEIGRAHV